MQQITRFSNNALHKQLFHITLRVHIHCMSVMLAELPCYQT